MPPGSNLIALLSILADRKCEVLTLRNGCSVVCPRRKRWRGMVEQKGRPLLDGPVSIIRCLFTLVRTGEHSQNTESSTQGSLDDGGFTRNHSPLSTIGSCMVQILNKVPPLHSSSSFLSSSEWPSLLHSGTIPTLTMSAVTTSYSRIFLTLFPDAPG